MHKLSGSTTGRLAKVVEVAKIAPKKSAHWSAAGAAGQAHVSCVIRQALVRS